MAGKKKSARASKAAPKSRATRERPNRIFALTQARGWTYADVAEKVRALAEQRGDAKRLKVHELTINRLAIGSITLTTEWMNMLAEVYQVPATEIISATIDENLRRVRVSCALQAGSWAANHAISEAQQFDIMVPNDPALTGVQLYAGTKLGPAMNRKYAENSILILSRLMQKPGEIVEGRRYHIRCVRYSDGLVEDSIKTLIKDDQQRYWLKPESTHPEFQTWIPLDGTGDFSVELIGRVRGVYFREE